MSKKQEELRATIAEKLYFLFGGCSDPFNSQEIAFQNLWLYRADKIMYILVDRCWLKGNEKLPRCTFGVKIFGEQNDGYKEGQEDMQRVMTLKGWRPVLPIEKE